MTQCLVSDKFKLHFYRLYFCLEGFYIDDFYVKYDGIIGNLDGFL